jgi:hypothetical protein
MTYTYSDVHSCNRVTQHCINEHLPDPQAASSGHRRYRTQPEFSWRPSLVQSRSIDHTNNRATHVASTRAQPPRELVAEENYL